MWIDRNMVGRSNTGEVGKLQKKFPLYFGNKFGAKKFSDFLHKSNGGPKSVIEEINCKPHRVKKTVSITQYGKPTKFTIKHWMFQFFFFRKQGA